jgi:type IV pilus modification protein PilV
MSQLRHNKNINHKSPGERGFSLIEAIIAMVILTVGVVGVAATIGSAVKTTDNSKYSNIASTLATEKLEDLNRWPSTDSHVAAGGSLTADTAAYFDDVSMAADGGAFTEVESAANGTFTSTTFNPSNNPIPLATSTATAPSVPVTFDRRWLVEQDPTINGVVVTGVRRITVWIQSVGAIQPPIIFQMSTVRP